VDRELARLVVLRPRPTFQRPLGGHFFSGLWPDSSAGRCQHALSRRTVMQPWSAWVKTLRSSLAASPSGWSSASITVGNLITNIDYAALIGASCALVVTRCKTTPFLPLLLTYGDTRPGAYLALVNSSG